MDNTKKLARIKEYLDCVSDIGFVRDCGVSDIQFVPDGGRIKLKIHGFYHSLFRNEALMTGKLGFFFTVEKAAKEIYAFKD